MLNFSLPKPKMSLPQSEVFFFCVHGSPELAKSQGWQTSSLIYFRRVTWQVTFLSPTPLMYVMCKFYAVSLDSTWANCSPGAKCGPLSLLICPAIMLHHANLTCVLSSCRGAMWWKIRTCWRSESSTLPTDSASCRPYDCCPGWELQLILHHDDDDKQILI